MNQTGKFSRRGFLKAGLAAGAGLALLDLYREGWSARHDKGSASLLAFQEFGLDAERISRLLELTIGRSGAYGDIFLEYSISNHLSFDGDQWHDNGIEVLCGGSIRRIEDGRTWFQATEDLSWDGLSKLARELSSGGKNGSRSDKVVLKKLEFDNAYPGASASAGPVSQKQDILARIVEGAKSADAKIKIVRATYRDTLRFVTVANSEGIIAYDTQPLLRAGATAAAVNADNGRSGLGMFNAGGHYGLEYFASHPPESIGHRAAVMARLQMEAVEAPSGVMPVVLAPAYSGVLLHEAVGHGLEGDGAVRGQSLYAGRIGETVASPLCTICDDGRMPGLNGSMNFDDEGTPSSATVLIDKGKLSSYLHSRDTAAKTGAKPTGNGRRQSFTFPPLPRMTNTYLQRGESSPEEIIGSVKRGIYARTFSGGSVNPSSGDFTFMALEAFLIEQGRITAPLSDVVLLGNGPEIMKRISMVGNDLEFSDNLWDCGKQGQMVPVSVGTPTVKIDMMTVGGVKRA